MLEMQPATAMALFGEHADAAKNSVLLRPRDYNQGMNYARVCRAIQLPSPRPDVPAPFNRAATASQTPPRASPLRFEEGNGAARKSSPYRDRFNSLPI